MLVICERLSASMSRPAYYPRKRWAQWVVYDTEAKQTVYGPTSRYGCQLFKDKEVTK